MPGLRELFRRFPERCRTRTAELFQLALMWRIPGNSYPVLRQEFHVQHRGALRDMLFKPSGYRLAANHSSVAVLGMCNGGRRIDEIESVLAREFSMPRVTVGRQVRQLIGTLVKSELVALHRGPLPPPFLVLRACTVIKSEVEEAVRFRMGRFYDHSLRLDDELAKAHTGRGRLLVKCRDGKPVLREPPSNSRDVKFIRRLTELDLPRVDFSVIFVRGDRGGQHATVPINSHSRIAGSDASILWPQSGYTTVKSGGFGRDIEKSDRPWTDKIPKAIWRGTTTGLSIKNLTEEEIDESISHPCEVKDAITGRVVPRANRLRLVSKYCHDEDVDVGFSSFAQIDEEAKAYFRSKGFLKTGLTRDELLRYKYQIVVDGNTFASQLPWTLHSRSVALMVPPSWEVIVEGITAWEHYVPLAPDFSDLKEKVQWCRSNDRRCMEISRASTALMRHYYDPGKEDMIQQRLIERYAENFRAG